MDFSEEAIVFIFICFKFEENNITAVSLHPGVVRTEIWRHLYHLNIESFVFFLFYPIFLFTTKNCRQGAQTTIHCAVADEIPYLNGSYFAYNYFQIQFKYYLFKNL